MDNILEFQELHDGHRLRQRERIIEEGLEALEEHEALEYMLSLALPRQDVNDLSHALLDHFGSLNAVLHAELPELASVSGMGKSAAQWIALAGEAALGINALEYEPQEDIKINCVYDLLKNKEALLRMYPAPCTVQICRNALGDTVYRRIITPSRLWGHPETLMEAASDVLSTGAKGVLLLQFVGKLPPRPEDYDLEYIQKYAFTLHAMGCSLLDMILISYTDVTSLRREGHIPDFKLGEAAAFLREDYLADLQDERALRLLGSGNTQINQNNKE